MPPIRQNTAVRPASRADRLAQVEPLRLSAHARWRGQLTQEQQQLHYQWFADLGSTDAKRALAHMLTQGARRDPVSALRYFRCGQRSCSSGQHAYKLGGSVVDPSSCHALLVVHTAERGLKHT